MLLLQVTFNKADITVSEILKVIQDAGFTAELLQKQDLQARQEVNFTETTLHESPATAGM